MFFCICLVGCVTVSPKQVADDRIDYNEMIQQTNLSELLSNIVRLHYSEPTNFHKFVNVSASYSVSSSFQPGVSYSSTTAGAGFSSIGRVLGLNGSVQESQVPTIVYARSVI